MIGLVAAALLAQSTTVVIQPESMATCTLPTYGDPLAFDYTYDASNVLQTITVTDTATGDAVTCYVTQRVNVSTSGQPAPTPTPTASPTVAATAVPSPTP